MRSLGEASARLARSHRGWSALLPLVLCSVALRAWAAEELPVPWIAPDEMVYGLIGSGIYRHATLDILGGPTPFYSLLTPLFAGAPLALGDIELGYSLLKVLQAVAMSLAAVPVYLWTRSLAGPRYALAAAALTLATPALVFSGLVMTEVLFYPLLVLAAWTQARALERPTGRRQALAVLALVAAVATRLQALVLFPAFLTAIALDAYFARSRRTAVKLLPSVAALAILSAAWLVYRLGSGTAVLGGYAVVGHTAYEPGRAIRFVLYHAGSLVVLTGFVPACALLLLLISALVRGEADRGARAYLTVTCSFVLWVVVEVGVFASRYVGRLAERDLIGLAPLLFVGLALWLRRGGPRGYWQTSIAAVLVAATLVALPLKRLVTAAALPDAPSLTWMYDLLHATSLSTLEVVFFVAAAVAIGALALLPRRLLFLLPLVLLAGLAGSSFAASRHAIDQSRALRAAFVGDDRRWIDHAASQPVAYLYRAGDDWTAVWQTIFWNRRVRYVYGLGGARVTGPVPQKSVAIRPDGRVRGDPSVGKVRYVIAREGAVGTVPMIAFVGEPVAQTARPGDQQGGLTLWKIEPPLRVSFRTTGLKPNGDLQPGSRASIEGYACDGRSFELTLLIKKPAVVAIARNGTPYRHLRFATPTTVHVTVPAVPDSSGGSCRLDLVSSDLVGATVFQMTP